MTALDINALKMAKNSHLRRVKATFAHFFLWLGSCHSSDLKVT